MICIIVFLFKQKTAYEMRISDWSSDVCSSDLFDNDGAEQIRRCPYLVAAADIASGIERDQFDRREQGGAGAIHERILGDSKPPVRRLFRIKKPGLIQIGRESCRERVCSTCRSRWSAYHSKKQHKENKKY